MNDDPKETGNLGRQNVPLTGMLGDWQPIETAPKDGRSIIICGINGEVTEAWFISEVEPMYKFVCTNKQGKDLYEKKERPSGYWSKDINPKWWMPMPPPKA